MLRPFWYESSDPFHDHGEALAATDAHGLHPNRLVRIVETVEERGHDTAAGHAERVAESDGPPVHVELIPFDTQVPGRRDHLRCEGLVDLDQVNVLDRHASPLHGL